MVDTTVTDAYQTGLHFPTGSRNWTSNVSVPCHPLSLLANQTPTVISNISNFSHRFLCFPVCCGSCFSSLESFLYYSVFLKQDISKWDKYFVSCFLYLSLVICLTVPFLSEALRQLEEDKPIYFGGSRWPPSGCLDFPGFSLVLIFALIEFRVYFGLCILQCFSVSSFQNSSENFLRCTTRRKKAD